MAGTREGGLAAAITNKTKHGSDFYRRIGSKGGVAKSPLKGFASMDPEKHRLASAKGGKIGRK